MSDRFRESDRGESDHVLPCILVTVRRGEEDAAWVVMS